MNNGTKSSHRRWAVGLARRRSGWSEHDNAAGETTPESAQPAAKAVVPAIEQYRIVFRQYCISCHNTKLRTAGLALDTLNIEDVTADAATWEKVLSKLRSGSMPPPGRPAPDERKRVGVANYLEASLDRGASDRPFAGKPLVHRLNRSEYTNAIRELLAVEIDSRSMLPADDAGYGFDNISDLLRVSPALLERYMFAAQKISRVAVGDARGQPTVETYRAPKTLLQDVRMSEELPFGSRGGLVFHHEFPLDGEYVIKIRLQRIFDGGFIQGLEPGVPEPIEVRLDGERMKAFIIGETASGRQADAQAPATQDEQLRTADAGLEFRFAAKAGRRVVGVTFPDKTGAAEGVESGASTRGQHLILVAAEYECVGRCGQRADFRALQRHGTRGHCQSAPDICLPTRRRSNAAPCARQILSALARRAYSRPVASTDVEALLEVYEEGRREGGFEAGIRFAMEKVLVSPDFLFRFERAAATPPGESAYQINDLDLASRLSLFLWSSLPDDQLLDLAERGTLHQPRRSRGAGAPDARGSSRERPGLELRGAVAVSARICASRRQIPGPFRSLTTISVRRSNAKRSCSSPIRSNRTAVSSSY